MIVLQRFTKRDNPAAFQSYLRIKYEVFVAEQGWQLVCDHQTRLATADATDACSCFVLATVGDSGQAVGVVRSTVLSEAFPHREHLEHHLNHADVSLRLDQLATVNAIAVVPDMRGVSLDIRGWEPMTIAKALMCEIVDWARSQDVLALVFTTIQGVPAVFFEHLGAYVIDPLFSMPTSGLPLVNMVLWLLDQERFLAKRSPLAAGCPPGTLAADQSRCLAYCQTRHREIVGDQTIEQFAGLTSAAGV